MGKEGFSAHFELDIRIPDRVSIYIERTCISRLLSAFPNIAPGALVAKISLRLGPVGLAGVIAAGVVILVVGVAVLHELLSVLLYVLSLSLEEVEAEADLSSSSLK